MAFCSKCGKELAEGAQFCSGCGTPVNGAAENDGSTRVQKFVGEIRKCPGCGTVLESFQAVCPACGLELRGNVAVASSVQKLATHIAELEMKRETTKGSIFSSNYGSRNKTDSSVINLIKSFAVPNTIEEIMEFMVLAESNIDVSAFKLGTRGKSAVDASTDREMASAWLSKMEQVYKKAELSFSTSPMFQEVKQLYEKKQKQIALRKKLNIIIPLSIVGAFIIIFVVALSLAALAD